MKKEYDRLMIEIFRLQEKEILRTSLGNPLPENDENWSPYF